MRKVPNFADPEVTKFLIELMKDLETNNRGVLQAEKGNRSLLLFSPSKKVYEVTVDDLGVLSTTYVAG